MNKKEPIQVLYIKVGRAPVPTKIDPGLSSMEQLVHGQIECYEPFDDPVAIICNEEGKIDGLPPNRAIRNEVGKIIEIICGDFFICYADPDSEQFSSLPPAYMEKYKTKFRYPDVFLQTQNGMEVFSHHPKNHFEPER